MKSILLLGADLFCLVIKHYFPSFIKVIYYFQINYIKNEEKLE